MDADLESALLFFLEPETSAMPASSKTFNIGRDPACDIRVPDVPAMKDTGRVHASLTVEDGQVTILANKAAYSVFVDRFRVKRKRVFPENEISIGRNFKFKLHHYFVFRGDEISGPRRRENDFTEEFRALEKQWGRNHSRQKELQSRFSKKDLPILAALVAIAVFEYLVYKTRYSMFLFSGAMPLMLFLKENKKKKITLKASRENVCPKCREYLEATWEDLKNRGGHSCGAFWRM